MAEIGLTAPDIARQVTGLVAKLDGRYERSEVDSVEARARLTYDRMGRFHHSLQW